MVLHRPADDPAAVQVHDGCQIEPSLIGLDVGDVGEPDPVRRGGSEVAVEQVRGDRKVVTAVGGPHPARPCHDGPDTVMAHQPLNTTAAPPTALSLQLGMDARAAIASACVAMDLLDVVNDLTVGRGSPALRAPTPGLISGRRGGEDVPQGRPRLTG